MERTPPSSFGSDPDLSRHNMNLRKRKLLDLESCNCELSFAKFQTEIMNTISSTIKSSIDGFSEKFEKFSTDLDSIKDEIKKIHTDNSTLTSSISEIKTRLCDIETATNFANDRQDNFETKLATFEQRSKQIDFCETEVLKLNKKITELQTELRKREQFDRILNLEIVGVPEKHDENLISILIQIAKFANVTVSPENIEFATRIQPKQAKPGVPHTIIVKLKNRLVKDNILAGIRRVRGITPQAIGMQGTQRIFVNEHLTLENKSLYKKCREIAIKKSFKYTWIRNCKIFTRKDDKSPKLAIKNEVDLLKIK